MPKTARHEPCQKTQFPVSMKSRTVQIAWASEFGPRQEASVLPDELLSIARERYNVGHSVSLRPRGARKEKRDWLAYFGFKFEKKGQTSAYNLYSQSGEDGLIGAIA